MANGAGDGGAASSSSSSSAPSTSGGAGRACRICAGRSDGAHFGVDACRACAAFFRRSVVMVKKYVCRAGNTDSQCVIDSGGRTACRRCRFLKCLQAGMLPDMTRRKGTVVSDDDEDDEMAVDQPDADVNLMPPPAEPSTSRLCPPPPLSAATSNPQLFFLQKLEANYKELWISRQEIERTLVGQDGKDTDNAAERTWTMLPSHHYQVNHIWKTVLPLRLRFCSVSYDGLADLKTEEKWRVYQNFVLLSGMLDSFYRMVKYFPEHAESRVFTSLTIYLDLDRLPDYFPRDEPKLADPVFHNSIRTKMLQVRDACIPYLERLKMTPIELVSVLTLMVWSPNASNSTERTRLLGERYTRRVMQELHVLYKDEYHLASYATRVGELCALASSFEWGMTQLRDELRLLDVFGRFDRGSYLNAVVVGGDYERRPRRSGEDDDIDIIAECVDQLNLT